MSKRRRDTIKAVYCNGPGACTFCGVGGRGVAMVILSSASVPQIGTAMRLLRTAATH